MMLIGTTSPCHDIALVSASNPFLPQALVDGLVKCEKWIRDDGERSEESRSSWWLNRLIGHTKTVSVDWPYPFVEDRLFVLTLTAGLEGYHVKWAVTYEEWPEEDYPIYANGPGYVISSDIADSILSEFVNHKLRLFKMEDVSMGMWVERFNNTRLVKYVHSIKFWDTEKWQPITSLTVPCPEGSRPDKTGSDKFVLSVAWSPDGKLLACGNYLLYLLFRLCLDPKRESQNLSKSVKIWQKNIISDTVAHCSVL